MRYYGRFDNDKDLITKEKGTEIANTQAEAKIATALSSGSIKTELDKKENADATILKQANIVDNVTSTSTIAPLSANQGKGLNDRINNLEAIGRFLSIWNCTTGLPITTPTENPYNYKTGDYYRVGTVGTTNYKPNGSSFTGVASTTQETLEVATNDVYFYDGSTWSLQVNHVGAFVSDVQVDGTSVVSGGVASLNKAATDTLGLVKYAQGTFSIAASSWTSDTTYADYPFRYAITVTNCTANHFADVAFDLASATGGKLAPVVETYAGGIYVYAKENLASAVTGTYKISYNA